MSKKLDVDMMQADPWEECPSCGEPVSVYESFFEDGKHFHPDCACVWSCAYCGEWNENSALVCECGEPKPERKK